MNDLIEEFENETELPATWNTGNMGGYTKEYTEWLAERAVNKNDLLQLVSNRRGLLIAYGEWIHELAGCKDTEKATTLADSYLSNL